MCLLVSAILWDLVRLAIFMTGGISCVAFEIDTVASRGTGSPFYAEDWRPPPVGLFCGVRGSAVSDAAEF